MKHLRVRPLRVNKGEGDSYDYNGIKVTYEGVDK